MNTPSLPKDIATTFLRLAAAGKVDEAYEAFTATDFRHHNPYFASDARALKAGMRDNARQHPDKVFEVQRVIAEGPLVAVHSRVHMPTSGMTIAVVHIFRFENGLIAELWDIGQAVPEGMCNELGMF
jgi:predicted SnoaL-like aldol condensation-catalyzing enzyme